VHSYRCYTLHSYYTKNSSSKILLLLSGYIVIAIRRKRKRREERYNEERRISYSFGIVGEERVCRAGGYKEWVRCFGVL